jgi:hypothetical protein
VSTFAQRTYPCPTCKVEARRTVAVSLNGGRRADLREAILTGGFQGFTCEACGMPYRVEDPFVYVDFERKDWISMFPPARERQWPALESEPVEDWRQSMVVHAAPVARARSEGMKVRAVFGLAALREKLLCFAHGLDDGWLEVLKLDLMRTPAVGLPFHPDARPRLTAVHPDKLELATHRGPMLVAREHLAEIQIDAIEWSEAYEALTRGAYVDLGRILLAPPR